jgi:hypothetical protein
MAKLDEIAEVLTEELEGFQKAIQQLEVIAKKLDHSHTLMEIENTRDGVSKLKQGQVNHFRKQRQEVHQLSQKLEGAKLIPKWLLGLFFSFLTSVMLVLGYSIFQASKIPKMEQTAYSQGESNAVRHFDRFMRERPKAGALYKEWLDSNGKE